MLARRLKTVALIAVAVVTSSCGGGSDVTTTTTTAAAPPVTSGGSVATIAPAEAGATALKRRDAPPEGVKAQFEYFQEGDGSCYGLDDSRPSAVVDFPTVEIAMYFIVCFPGFAPNQAVEAQFRLPDGTSRQATARNFNSPEGVPYLEWTSLPGDPTGTYEVTASQRSLRGGGRFTVSTASQPRMVAAPPREGPPGTTFRFGLAGFSPNSAVPLHLYRADGQARSYLTTLSPSVDGKGQTVLSIPTAPDDVRAEYCLLRRGPKAAPDYTCSVTFTLA